MWGIAKYFAELDFRQRRQAGQAPIEAWTAVKQRVAQLIEPNGYSLTCFAPELYALQDRLIPVGSPRDDQDVWKLAGETHDRQFWLDLTRELHGRVDLLWEERPVGSQAYA